MLTTQSVLTRHTLDEVFPEGATRTHVRDSLKKFFPDDGLIIERLALMSELEYLEIPGIGATGLSIMKLRLGLFDIMPRKKHVSKLHQLAERFPGGLNTVPVGLYTTIWEQNSSIDYAIVVLSSMYDIELSLGDLMSYDKDVLIDEISEALWEQRGLDESNEQVIHAVNALDSYFKELRPTTDDMNSLYEWSKDPELSSV